MASLKSKKAKISREKAEQEVGIIRSTLEAVERIRFCGSYRRNAKTVGDIDVVVVPSDHALCEASILTMAEEVFTHGKKQIRIFSKNKIQIDFYLTTNKFFESHCLFLTGSKFFNIKSRQVAKTLGFRLSQYGLNSLDGQPIALGEEEILGALGMTDYFDPEARSI